MNEFQLPKLALDDPLSGHEVVISIRVKPDAGTDRKDREVILSVGVQGQIPLMSTVGFEKMPDEINRLWIKAAQQLDLALTGQDTASDSTSEEAVDENVRGTSQSEDEAEHSIDEDDLF
ncbi:MAG: hypothetical protein AAGD96_11330 [Chloroflexota bacterium]